MDSPYAKNCKDKGGSVYTKKDGSCGCKETTSSIAGQDTDLKKNKAIMTESYQGGPQKGDTIVGIKPSHLNKFDKNYLEDYSYKVKKTGPKKWTISGIK